RERYGSAVDGQRRATAAHDVERILLAERRNELTFPSRGEPWTVAGGQIDLRRAGRRDVLVDVHVGIRARDRCPQKPGVEKVRRGQTGADTLRDRVKIRRGDRLLADRQGRLPRQALRGRARRAGLQPVPAQVVPVAGRERDRSAARPRRGLEPVENGGAVDVEAALLLR